MLKHVLIASIILMLGMAAFRLFQERSAGRFDLATMPLFTEVHGIGSKKIVLAHGLMGSSQYWRPRLGKLTDDHSILLVDLVGFGRSPKPDSNYSLDIHIAALKDAMTRNGFWQSGTTIVGHSLGAVVTAGLLAENSDIVLNGVLASLPIYKNRTEAETQLSNVSYLHRGMIQNSHWVHLSCYFRDVYRLPIFLPFTSVPLDVHLDAFSHTWTSLALSMENSIVGVDTADLVRRAAATHRLLFIQHTDDDVAPFQNVLDLSAQLSGTRFHSMGVGGHNGFLTVPQNYWDEIISFENVQ